MLRRPEASRQEPPEEELSRLGAEPLEPSPTDPERDDPGRLVRDPGDAQIEPDSVHERPYDPEEEHEPERQREQAPPVVGRDAVDHELVAVGDHVEPRERDRRVDREVHRVPPLVREPSADDDDRGDDDREQERGADRGGDDPRVGRGRGGGAAERRCTRLRQRQPVPVLAQERVAVLAGVTPDREDDVREHEPDHRVPVAAVPDREPVEADRALEERQPGEQQHLDQCHVAGEERRQPPEADQRSAEAVPVVAETVGAARGPEPDDPHGIAQCEDTERDGDRRSGGRPRAREPLRQAPQERAQS